MRPVTVLLLALAAAPAVAAPASEAVPAVRTVADVERRIADVELRLTRLVERGKVEFKIERIRLYRSMRPRDLADPLRGVTVEEILRYVADETAPAEVREEGSLAICADVARRADPDLSEEGRGLKRPRATFSMKVTPMLTAKDLHTRSLGQAILEALWPGMSAREPDVARYDPRKKDTWWEGRRGWEKQLKR